VTEEEFQDVFPFDTDRRYQKKIVQTIDDFFTNKNKKNLVACLPTAIGKSAISVALARHYGNAYFLTSQKSLQRQYKKDFSGIGMNLVLGKYNYTCKVNNSLKCDAGVCVNPKEFDKAVPKDSRFRYDTSAGKGAGLCRDCPYLVARDRALKSDLCCMNYAYFFNMVRADKLMDDPSRRKIQKRKLLVLDECHGLEKELISFMTTKISITDFKEFELGRIVNIPNVKLSDDEKFDWLFGECLAKFQATYKNEMIFLSEMNQKDSAFRLQTRKTKYLDTIVCMIRRLQEQMESVEVPGVVIQKNQFEISFKPLFSAEIAMSYLYEFADKILFMSATVFDKNQYYKTVGIKAEESAFINCGSPIPLEKRPVKVLNAVTLNYKEKERNKPKLLELVRDILNHHQGERGIIHTVNFDIAEFLMDSLGDDRLVMPRGKERDRQIHNFMTSSRDDLVLISPSLTEGISLDDELSRFSIICKMPFGNLGDPWIKKRMEIDNNWYAAETVQSLVQMTGRVVRSPEDEGVNYILDKGFQYLFQMNHHKFPKWWKESIKVVKNGECWKS
jgi:Rad3-related DNA helicase